MSRSELLLAVGAEGGSIAIYGRHEGDRTQYRVGIVDQTLTSLDDDDAGDEIRSESGWLNTWEEAVAKIDRWPWPNLYPRFVHPSIRDAIWKAVQDYSERVGRSVRQAALDGWRSAYLDSESER